MTALRHRAEAITGPCRCDAAWTSRGRHETHCAYDNFCEEIESTLLALVEECAQVAIRRRIADVDGDWDRGYNMAVADIAQAIREKGGAD